MASGITEFRAQKERRCGVASLPANMPRQASAQVGGYSAESRGPLVDAPAVVSRVRKSPLTIIRSSTSAPPRYAIAR
jgi:hypothetical protein